MAYRRPVAPDGVGGLSQIVAADPLDAAILAGSGVSRRPLAPDSAGRLSQIAPPDFIDPSILPAGGGPANVTATTRPGINVSTGPLALRAATARAGVLVSLGASKLTPAPVRPGIAVSVRPVAGATIARPVVAGGIKVGMGPFRSLNPPATDKAGFKVTQHTLTLTRQIGSNSVTQSAITGSGFATPANAQGLHDATFSTLTGSITAAQAGTLTGTYVDADSSKSSLFTIASVTLKLYWKIVGDTLSSAVVTRSCSSTGGLASTPLGASASGTQDHSGTPESFDLTAAIGGSWAKLAGFRFVFNGSTPLANTATIGLDSGELIIVTSALVTAQ